MKVPNRKTWQKLSSNQRSGINKDFKKVRRYLRTLDVILKELGEIHKDILKDVKSRTKGIEKALNRLLMKWKKRCQVPQVKIMITKIFEAKRKLVWINTAIWYANNSITGLQVKYPRQFYYTNN